MPNTQITREVIMNRHLFAGLLLLPSAFAAAAPAVTSLSGNTTLDKMRSYCLEDTPTEDGLDRLARKVLRLTLESVRMR